jgi:erythromycin esterase
MCYDRPNLNHLRNLESAVLNPIIITARSAGWLVAAMFGLVASIVHVAAQDQEDVRKMIEHNYEQMALALGNKDVALYTAFFMPNAKTVDTSGSEHGIVEEKDEIVRMVQSQSNAAYRYAIDGPVASGRDVIVTAKLAGEMDMAMIPGQRPVHVRVEAMQRHIWVRTGDDWRIGRSEVLQQKAWINNRLADDREAVPPLTAQERAAVVRDLGVYAFPFKTVHAGNGFGDLEFFDRIVGDAQIVALGEASHGTAEFFQMKHRLLEYLIEKKGFTVLAIEGNWSEAEVADRFIKTGEGNAAAALAAMHFWTWQTEEVRALLDSMRAYNARRGDRPVLSFAGFDMQYAKMAAQRVLDYFGRLDDSDRDHVRQLYSGIEKLDELSETDVPVEEKLRLKDNAARALDLFDSRREALLKEWTAEDYRDARQAARIVLQACEMHVGAAGTVRDRAMADNVRWLIEDRFPNEKIVLWAHNDHVGTAQIGGEKSQGMHLRERYGARMVVLGFGAHHGEVRALRIVDGKLQRPPVALTLAPPRSASIEALFHETGMPRFVLDFRLIPKESTLGRWLGGPKLYRSIGSAYDPEGDNYVSARLPEIYDGLIFIDETTAAKPVR